jgi:lipopolysaccharide/colanic/teichoic acid biosynthesis glycosyltransferase
VSKIRATIRDAAVRFANLAGWLTIVDPLILESYRGQDRLICIKTEPQSTRMLSKVKRGMDIVGATAALILFLPLFLVLSLLIKLTSKGPIFSESERIGYRGLTFKIYKFRTMSLDAEESRDSMPWGGERIAAFRLESDPRTTPLGRFLRKTALNELPQLWNVLKGDMSLVGPRPVTVWELEVLNSLSDELKRIRLSVAPGITGLGYLGPLIRGTPKRRMTSDYYFIRNLDLDFDRATLVEIAAADLNVLRQYVFNQSTRLDFMIFARATRDWFLFRLLGIS